MLSAHKPTANTLLISPNWEFTVRSEEGCAKLNEKLLAAVKTLTENHIEFDITDCNYVEKHFGKGRATVGIKTYDNIVYVSGGASVMQPIFERLKRTEANLFVFEDEETFETERLKTLAKHTEFESVKGDHKDVLVFRKTNESGDCIFLFNNTDENTVVKIKTEADAALYDLEKDAWLTVKATGGFAELSLEGYAFHALKLSTAQERAGEYTPVRYEKKVLPHEEHARWTYLPPVDVKACIARYDLSVTFEGKGENFENVQAGQLREIYAGDNERILIDAVNDATIVRKNYPVRAVFTAKFKGKDATKMLFETETFAGEVKIFLNGEALDEAAFQRVTVYDFKNLEVDVSGILKDENELQIVFEKATETNGIIGEIYFY